MPRKLVALVSAALLRGIQLSSLMPVYTLHCPDCDRIFKGLVLAGTRAPAEWVCSVCGGNKAKRVNPAQDEEHPLESEHGTGCPCCQ